MLFGTGLPPLMLTAVEFFPAELPAFAPPRLSGAPPAPPLVSGAAATTPPGAPSCLPSGEIATRAARLPCGGATGATGPGLADSAMSVEELALEFWLASSGAGPLSPDCARSRATRGAAPAFSSSLGRAGELADGARVISAG